MAAVDTKRGNVDMCKGRSAQQESGAALSKNSMFKAGPKIIYIYYTRCALIIIIINRQTIVIIIIIIIINLGL